MKPSARISAASANNVDKAPEIDEDVLIASPVKGRTILNAKTKR